MLASTVFGADVPWFDTQWGPQLEHSTPNFEFLSVSLHMTEKVLNGYSFSQFWQSEFLDQMNGFFYFCSLPSE